jgi:iron complex outermembrane receptor protein
MSLLFGLLLAFSGVPSAPALQDAEEPQKTSQQSTKDTGGAGLQPVPPISTFTRSFLDRATATMTVISGDDIESLGVRSIADALRIVPGVEIQKISSTESSVSLRSYTAGTASSQGVLGLVNGRQVFNEFFGGVFWENLPVLLDEIKSIEVIRGPGSFFYGPNAMHGLVNIQTKTPLDYFAPGTPEHEVILHAEGGTYRSNLESLIFVHHEGDSALKVKVAHDDIAQFEGGGGTRNKGFFEAMFETRPAVDQRILVTAGASRQDFDVLIPTTPGPPPSVLPPATFHTHANEFYGQVLYALGRGSDEPTASLLTAQVDWNHFSAIGDPNQVYIPFTVFLDTADLDLQYRFGSWGPHVFTAGSGFRYDTFTTQNSDVSMGRHATWLAWIFVQDEIEIVRERLFLTGGGRLDQHSTAGTSIAPRMALVWQFARDELAQKDQARKRDDSVQSLRLTAGSGFRNPSLRDLWFNMPLNGIPGTIGSNRDLKPEELKSFEFGYWGRPTPRLQMEASTYYNRADRLVAFQPVSLAPLVFARENVGREDAYGIETNVEYQLTTEVYAFGNYSYEIRRDREDGYKRIPGGPRNKASAGVRILPAKGTSGLGAMLWGTFFDESDFQEKGNGTSLGGVPAYTLLNGSVWYPFKIGSAEGRVFVQGLNLLDHRHKEHPDGQTYGLLGVAGVEIAW